MRPSRVQSISATVVAGSCRYFLEQVINRLGPDEVEVILRIAERLVAGRAVYGELKLASDKRDFRREALEESLDMAIYAAAALNQRSVRAATARLRMVKRLEAAADRARAPESPHGRRAHRNDARGVSRRDRSGEARRARGAGVPEATNSQQPKRRDRAAKKTVTR